MDGILDGLDDGFNPRLFNVSKKLESEVDLLGIHPSHIGMGRFQIPLDLLDLFADRLRKFNRQKGTDQSKTPSSSPCSSLLIPVHPACRQAGDRQEAGPGVMIGFDGNTNSTLLFPIPVV